jgi:hypothetical protein
MYTIFDVHGNHQIDLDPTGDGKRTVDVGVSIPVPLIHPIILSDITCLDTYR